MFTATRKLTPLAIGILCALYGAPSLAESLPTLDETTTDASEVTEVTTLNQQDLQDAPHNNPTISQALKSDSSVGINDGQTSLRAGDLAPEEISISGARPHQTKYTIGGVGINNITTFANDTPSNGALSSGHTSGYFLDTTLLESVEVMDKNIDAEFGGFTGGVVNAELRKPTDEFKVEYQYRMTDSDWNSAPKVSDKLNDDYDEANNGDGKYQPNYQKRMHSLHLSGAVSDTQKLAINVSKQESDIPQSAGNNVDQGMNNLFLTHIWESVNWRTTSDLRYSQYSSNLFLNDGNQNNAYQENSNGEQAHLALGGTFKVERFADFGTWETSVSYDRLSDERKSDADYLRTNLVMDFVPAFSRTQNTEGGYGNLKQYQDSIQLKTVARFDPLYWGETKHTANIGLEGALHKSTAKRSSDHLSLAYEKVNGAEKVRSMVYYEAGSYSAEAQQLSLFMNDKLEWDRLTLNLGSRVEHNDVFKQTMLSPRLTASWDFDQNSMNRVTLGASRYYSNALLGWALQAEGSALRTVGGNCTPNDGNWDSNDKNNYTCATNRDYNKIDLTDADTPYSDELTAAWAIDVDNFAVETAYVYRQQRKGLSLTSSDTLINNIESDTGIVSLDISTINAYPVASGYFSANWKVAYSQREGSGNITANYDDENNLGTGVAEEWVVVDGKLVRTDEMDTGGYQSPIKSNLSMLMFWPESGVTWNNRINYEQGRDLTVYAGVESHDVNGDGINESVKSVETATMKDFVTWDTALNWTPNLLKKHTTFGVSITNLLNEQVEVSKSGTFAGGRDNSVEYYSKGREVWLSMTVRN